MISTIKKLFEWTIQNPMKSQKNNWKGKLIGKAYAKTRWYIRRDLECRSLTILGLQPNHNWNGIHNEDEREKRKFIPQKISKLSWNHRRKGICCSRPSTECFDDLSQNYGSELKPTRINPQSKWSMAMIPARPKKWWINPRIGHLQKSSPKKFHIKKQLFKNSKKSLPWSSTGGWD